MTLASISLQTSSFMFIIQWTVFFIFYVGLVVSRLLCNLGMDRSVCLVEYIYSLTGEWTVSTF